jgi:hypothetical protein
MACTASAVADDPGIQEQPLDLARAEPGDDLRVEALERLAEGHALAQDRDPRESRLEALQAQELEQRSFVAQRQPPLLVVVRHVERVVAAPPAARHAVVAERRLPRCHRHAPR